MKEIDFVIAEGVLLRYEGQDEEVTLPPRISTVGAEAFCGASLRSVRFSQGVTILEDRAFACCHALEEIVLPAGVLHVESTAFADCPRLKRITLARGNPIYYTKGNCLIERIPKKLVLGCGGSRIPSEDGLLFIDDEAFCGIASLRSIRLPAELLQIGARAFAGCSALSRIDYAGSVAMWQAIKKKEDWDAGLPAYAVHCTDGIL